jgi:hypothetical protein
MGVIHRGVTVLVTSSTVLGWSVVMLVSRGSMISTGNVGMSGQLHLEVDYRIMGDGHACHQKWQQSRQQRAGQQDN